MRQRRSRYTIGTVCACLVPLLILTALATTASAQTPSEPVRPEQVNYPLETSLSDSLFKLLPDSLLGKISYLQPLEVVADPVDRLVRGGESNLGSVAITDRAERNLADLGTLLPSTRVSVNSRGESQFMVRGAPERHLRVFFDGIPLTLPWDERADLSLLPVEAVAAVVASRGPVSALDGYGVLAGRITLNLRHREEEGGVTTFTGRLGEGGDRAVDLLHLWRKGQWHLLAAGALSRRDGFILPGGFTPRYNQGSSTLRRNSDLQRYGGTLRLEREISGDGVVALTLLGTVARKGVPPESHLPDARFWRYPDTRRLLIGLSIARDLHRGGGWRLVSHLNLDLARLAIREFDDADYRLPLPAPGTPYEIDDDHSLYGRCRLTRPVGGSGELALQGELRFSTHLESLVRGGAQEHYSQRVISLVTEYRGMVPGTCRLRLGGGWEGVATPRTGDKPARGGSGAPLVLIRCGRDLGERTEAYLTISRRSRFPSMRELFSGALGKFKPNPMLGPERQDLVEMGGRVGGTRFEVAGSVYLADLHGGIEKARLVNQVASYQRINVGRIRSRGLELLVAGNPLRGLRLSAQHTLLWVRQMGGDGSWTLPAEDRPEYLSYLSLAWTGSEGWRLRLECSLTGDRYSADTTAGGSGLRLLPAAARYGGRLGWLLPRLGGPISGGEIFIQVSNLLDETVFSQTGLVEPGRMGILGLRLELNR